MPFTGHNLGDLPPSARMGLSVWKFVVGMISNGNDAC